MKNSLQARKLGRFLLALYILPVLFLAGVVLASLKMDAPFGLFTRDPASYSNLHPLTGISSNLGFMVWIAAATICLFCAILLRNNREQRTFANFLTCSGLLTVLLACDDFFMLHDGILPRYVGLDEKFMYSLYACLTLSGAVIFWRCIMETEFAILILAIGFFALSLCIDLQQETLEQDWGEWRIFFEDGFKLLGIVGWFGYFSRCGYKALRAQ